jgi:DNA-binding MarR family transcriptional regulator
MSNGDSVSLQLTHHVRDNCLCLATQRAARALARLFDDALRPVGITSGQFSLLMSLNQPAPPSIGSVAALLAMDRTTLTANLKPLEARGLLKINVDPNDKRSRLLTLTAAGKRTLAKAAPIWTKTHQKAEAVIARTTPSALRAGLRDLSKTLGRAA